ncbi:MAG TPA: prolyl oligopeptidase family serine peptidase [Verrucomicrobiae bacterium]
MHLWSTLPLFEIVFSVFLAANIPVLQAAEVPAPCQKIAGYFAPPAEYANRFGNYKRLVETADGNPLKKSEQWQTRRAEIHAYWDKLLGPWPPLISHPRMETLSVAETDGITHKRVSLPIAPNQSAEGWLLLPQGRGPFPAVFVPYYEPETSVGKGKEPLRDFGLQLAKRGFVTLSIGSPGGDARKPPQTRSQPLYFLAYVSANCANALASLPQVDPARIGIAGHSYGGKWAMFSAAFSDKFACGVWSDPGIVFDEKRSNVNYWEPWYLGFDANRSRKPGVVTPENPRTGAYKTLMEEGHDLTEVLALMAPRPFLVSGGSEDRPERWMPLNRVREVYELLSQTNRVAMTNRPNHTPTEESNEVIYEFFECFLKKQK